MAAASSRGSMHLIARLATARSTIITQLRGQSTCRVSRCGVARWAAGAGCISSERTAPAFWRCTMLRYAGSKVMRQTEGDTFTHKVRDHCVAERTDTSLRQAFRKAGPPGVRPVGRIRSRREAALDRRRSGSKALTIAEAGICAPARARMAEVLGNDRIGGRCEP